MNFDGHNTNISTACGGIMSVLLYIISGLFLFQQGLAIITRSETEFTSAKYVVDQSEMDGLTM